MKTMGWVLTAALAAGAAGGAYYYQQQQQHNGLPQGFAQSNGRLELKRYDVASLYPGRVSEMLVDEGQEVAAGDAVAKLSSETSNGQLAAAQAQKQREQEAVARVDAEIKAQQQQQKVAQLDLGNAQAMKKEALVSDAEVSKRLAARDGAAAAVKAAQAAKAEALAAVAAAQAQIDQAASANKDLVIRAPKNGRVEYRLTEVGSVIAAGYKVVSLLDPSDVSMNIFLPNAQMSRLKVGDEARIRVDGIEAVIPAKVSYISSEAQFTPKAVETSDERAKLMFKVKLQVPRDTANKLNRVLKGGMSGLGYVRTDSTQNWPSEWAVKLPQ